MMAAFRRCLGLFKHRRDGATALEFAFVAPLLLAFVLGTMELGMVAFSNIMLEGALREAARNGITGPDPPPGFATKKDYLVSVVNQYGGGIIQIAPSDLTTQVYPDFGSIGQPEPFTNTNTATDIMPGSIPVYDVGEPFVDVNCSGVWEDDMGFAGLGEGSDIVLYTVTHEKPLMTGLFDHVIGTGGKYTLKATVVVRNEPFDGGTGPGVC